MTDLRLSLEHMTMLGLAPVEIIEAAEALDVTHASLILDTGSYPLDVVSFLREPQLAREVAARLKNSPVRIHAAEGFLLDEHSDFDRLRRLLDISAELGVERGVVMVVDPDRGRVIERFARLCELASPQGLQISLEFVAFTPVSGLADALNVVAESGAANAAISVDLLHLTRSGGSPCDLAAGLPYGAAQLCDGPAKLPRDRWETEGLCDRLAPGDGEFPVREFLAALPAGLVVGVETPMGFGADDPRLFEEARRSVTAARSLSSRFA